uniref:Uncharacterized protein n=1 Tax=Escherichia coli TaxID=562 RepID=A0A6N0IG58_ECOLX|nr:hypothetical protein HPE44_03745 [Escherichia coli]
MLEKHLLTFKSVSEAGMSSTEKINTGVTSTTDAVVFPLLASTNLNAAGEKKFAQSGGNLYLF